MRGMAASILVCIFTVSMPFGLAGQRGRAELNEGNRLYEEGRFDEAHESYLEALRDAPDSPLARFNDGNALYQTEEYQRALEAYRQAIEADEPSLASPAWYNLGNALYRQGQFQESLDAFKQALRIDPEEGDYKHNLERALEQLEEQEQDQQSGDGNGQDQNRPDQTSDQDQRQEEQDQESGNQDQGQPPQSDQQDESGGGGQPQQGLGEMNQEEAERLLQAVQEDPGEVNRRGAPLRGRRPRKPW